MVESPTLDAPETQGSSPDENPLQSIPPVMRSLSFRWNGKPYQLEINEADLVLDLKSAIFSLTNVPPERQKILGLVARKLPDEDAPLSTLNLAKVVKPFQVIGTPEGQEVTRSADDAAETWDIALSQNQNEAKYLQQREQRKVIEAASRLELDIMNPPRPGKKLLVLDLDYTLMDCKRWQDPSVSAIDFARPGLEAFLTAVYPHYDLVIWSQTHWRFLESKLIELNMVGGTAPYLISFVLDNRPMFEVVSQRDGKAVTHHVKALDIIWRKLPEYYTAKNTLHIDDLSRNFKLNPQNGIKVHAFRHAHHHRDDRELTLLTKYLLHHKDVEDVRTLSVDEWRHQAKRLP